ncbi:hypothetical protein [Pseudacidobacterium ailaaui]|jgi:hypothetical protein|uniref:hypothetical protein n=1 Tax=Pseudacidobacterium ailaaui TaxID=1382359 RepID=UPI00047EB1C9|nr:hypothetical protein [Pseudacidobacterium ailaaui]MBX6360457.1 hypothetical protein [Pseudacidobacterium ailaaui]MCL6463762.1 hypothetical protein [Pseudacidobacterium ailaaui]MDI3255565.1 hypothetical protein [Bacillota bacterium]
MKFSLVHATMLAGATLLLASGCETGRTNKLHATWQHVSDETTTGKPQMASTAPATGQPPVPGSPTAAGPDGLQPEQDSEARPSPGVEAGKPIPYNRQKKDPFERQ